MFVQWRDRQDSDLRQLNDLKILRIWSHCNTGLGIHLKNALITLMRLLLQMWSCQLRYWESGKIQRDLLVLLGFRQSTEDKMSTVLCCKRLCIHHKSTRNSYFFFTSQVSNCLMCHNIPISSYWMSWLVYLSPLLDNQFVRSLSSFVRNFNNWIKFDFFIIIGFNSDPLRGNAITL